MAVFQIYPTGIPSQVPTLYSDNGDYAWSQISNLEDYKMPVHSWSLQQGVGKVLAKLKNYINLHNLGTSTHPIGSGYYTDIGTSGSASWWNDAIGQGITNLYVRNLVISGDYHYHNPQGATYGTVCSGLFVIQSGSPIVGASSYLNDVDLSTINGLINSWNDEHLSSNVASKERTNVLTHTHKNVITLAGMSGALGYFLPLATNKNSIYLQELNILSGHYRPALSSEIVINSGIFIVESGNYFVPETNFAFKDSPPHKHDGVSGTLLTLESIGTLTTTQFNSGNYDDFTINNSITATGVLAGCDINDNGWTSVTSYTETAPSIYSFINNLVLSRDFNIYRSTNLGTDWTNVYESPEYITHNHLTTTSRNQNKFRIIDNKLFLARSGEIVSTTDLSSWAQEFETISGYNNGKIIDSLLYYSIDRGNEIYYSGGSFYYDESVSQNKSKFYYLGYKKNVDENLNLINYHNKLYYTTSGKLYTFTGPEFDTSEVIYDTGYSLVSGGPIKIYDDKIYFAVGSGLYKYYNQEIELENDFATLINDMHVFSGFLFVAGATGLFKTHNIMG